jgi:uncharacterized damage-inducible protein DinB
MLDVVKPLHEVFTMNTGLVNLAMQNVTETQASHRFDPGTNNSLWILGHITSTRHDILSMLGQPSQDPWQGVFKKGINELSGQQLPSAEVILAEWKNISEKLAAQLNTVSSETLKATPPSPFPTTEQTMLAGVAFLGQHESYHVGQLSFIRRLLSEDGLYKVRFPS